MKHYVSATGEVIRVLARPDTFQTASGLLTAFPFHHTTPIPYNTDIHSPTALLAFLWHWKVRLFR
jgi:hypothetical protein